MKRRNLIGSLLAGIGLLAARPGPSAAAAPAQSEAPSAAAGSSARATVRVIYANATEASWEAITTDGVLVGGSTSVSLGNLQIIRDAANAIVAAGGPALGRQQIALFGGQS